MSCKNCKFFKEISGVYGECRRYPPTASLHGNAVFPTILCNMDNCGEFKTNPNENENKTVKTTRYTKKGA